MSSDVFAFVDGPYAPTLSAPVHIEGSDFSLATEILPAPPPLTFIRLPMNRRPGDLAKRPLPSFIPTSDPGSTYATHSTQTPMVTTTAGAPDDQGRRKRARIDKLYVVNLQTASPLVESFFTNLRLSNPFLGSTACTLSVHGFQDL